MLPLFPPVHGRNETLTNWFRLTKERAARITERRHAHQLQKSIASMRVKRFKAGEQPVPIKTTIMAPMHVNSSFRRQALAVIHFFRLDHFHAMSVLKPFAGASGHSFSTAQVRIVITTATASRTSAGHSR